MRTCSIRKRLFSTLLVVSMITLSGCVDEDIGNIKAAYISPTGEYQAEIVQISYGATGGQSCIYVETAGAEAFPKESERNTKKSIRIDETRGGWASQYSIEWISDDTFIVVTEADSIRYYSVEMDGKKYSLTEGLETDESKTTIHERVIDGNAIEIPVTVYVRNNIDDYVHVEVRMKALTSGTPRGVVNVTGKLILGPNEEGNYDVTLTGVKESDVEYMDEELHTVRVYLIQIGK